ncbi:NAD(P)-dependent oxidoreductase [Streptomyces zagrosensis]|uniref:3-hydroxyisobutyrate dehydrogenase-like beta-hydroxyacid dehydrogenase n=1 Tax=Streptomyces zagrosensis TaxID=1042984 RepID=A0A7W9UX72_9ACTN|nr:NAD(P)-binding domain-containing protein [Streptomyces zagrosensis]MBB5934307.1 3-hydroxyisobutyrate dehydrogenase-like beta-hydroxyacid dehydrogenase [Streptomyces zagrosensis]
MSTSHQYEPQQHQHENQHQQRITVIGLGNLGRALAGAFLDAGYRVTVWNRSAAKAEPLVAKGARRAETVADAVAAGDLVIVCVLDYDAVRELLAPAADALAGRVLVNVTSGIPEQVRELAGWVSAQGASYLDGAVYAVPQTVGTPSAFVFYSGSSAAFDAHRERLELLGSALFTGPQPDTAAVYDTAVLSGMYGMFAGFFHAVALGGANGIKAADITAPLVRWLHEAAAALPGFADEIDSGDYTTETSNLDINAGGLRAILTATRAQGVPTDLLAPLQALFDEQITQGHGTQSLARTVESLRERGPLRERDGAAETAGS